MEFNENRARHFEGKMIRYKNENGEWMVGKVVKVSKDGMEISELTSSDTNDGYGFGFFGPRPFFFRRRIFRRRFIPFGRPFFPFFFF